MKTIHPFPARMAPEIIFSYLPERGKGQWVLDPMAGSGTTVAAARSRGFHAVGTDTDPLALTISRANSRDLNAESFVALGERVYKDAAKRALLIRPHNAYPLACDDETRDFINYWFDKRARVELAALSRSIESAPPRYIDFMRCAFSRMIITKKNGVSLGEDVSHSRPHVTRAHPPIYPLQLFPIAVKAVARYSSFSSKSGLPIATVRRADCRALPFKSGSFHYIITSPPYLNAIDYMRGHKMTLVWFGHTIAELRQLRSSNIGTECGRTVKRLDHIVHRMITSKSQPTGRLKDRLRLYVADLDCALAEMRRVARIDAQAVFVVGDCTIRGCDVQNSIALDLLARRNGFEYIARHRRSILESRRYLAPPSRHSREAILRRMWEEVVLVYRAA